MYPFLTNGENPWKRRPALLELPRKTLPKVTTPTVASFFAAGGQEASKVAAAVAASIRREGGFITGWGDPWTVQGSAGSHPGQELLGVGVVRRANVDARAHRASRRRL